MNFEKVVSCQSEHVVVRSLHSESSVGLGSECLFVSVIGFTLLYFKMAIMPLVPKTKMADVGKLISLGNLSVRKVTLLVLTTTSATLILSHAFGADCIVILWLYDSQYIMNKIETSHETMSE